MSEPGYKSSGYKRYMGTKRLGGCLCEEKYNHYIFIHQQETMSQRLLKCTICSGDHSIFHCISKCAQPPQKKKRKAPPPQSNQQLKDKPSYQELKKKGCCRVGGTRKRCGRVGQSSANKVRGHQDSEN
ncbi:unnamed protein product [Pocillopora meandrina]|uniref:Uncharacterized protein n=1 Tax=Pocillopora meandrina TaxID=46732 RepID=A0AAU9WZL0_9CNID|nr:unnamed protein product [Pocillopora meandrina]